MEQTWSSSRTSGLHSSCPRTKRAVTTVENGLTLVPVPRTLLCLCRSDAGVSAKQEI